ncbi:hypothetical protein [Georgenia daeguensis]|uniref:Uncharacterized protein n=1 Tax=Georgenia daeguensis TaxID=908355 RepID=A0ABP8EXH4_9MICO
MRRDRPVVYDVSSIDDTDMDLQTATLLACWSAGFGTVNVATPWPAPASSRGGTTRRPGPHVPAWNRSSMQHHVSKIP